MSRPTISEQAFEMASQLETVVNALPAYATRPNLSIGVHHALVGHRADIQEEQ
ncbi:hypothetical protein [Mycolicibacterium sp. XJ775]